MNESTKSTLLVLSGGLDSLVLAYQLSRSGTRFRALYLDFGKSVSRREIAVVKSTAAELHFPLEIADIAGITRMQLGYIADEHLDRDEADIKGSDPEPGDGSYVSGFQVLLGVAAYYAQLTKNSSMTLGAIKEQFDKYPQLNRIFSQFAEIISLLNPELNAFSVNLPFSTMSKADVVALGTKLRAPVERSWSCLFGHDVQCGVCAQCKSRRDAFRAAKVSDPTNYREK